MATQIESYDIPVKVNQEVTSAALSLLTDVDSLFQVLEKIGAPKGSRKLNGGTRVGGPTPGKTSCFGGCGFRIGGGGAKVSVNVPVGDIVRTSVEGGTKVIVEGLNVLGSLFGKNPQPQQPYYPPPYSNPNQPQQPPYYQYPPPQQPYAPPYNQPPPPQQPPYAPPYNQPPPPQQPSPPQRPPPQQPTPQSPYAPQPYWQSPYGMNQSQNINYSGGPGQLKMSQNQSMGPFPTRSSVPSQTKSQASSASPTIINQLYSDLKQIEKELNDTLKSIVYHLR